MNHPGAAPDPTIKTALSARILIVDDSSMMRSMLRRMVGSEPGWTVIDTAVDGREAIEKAASLQPDICLLDLEMPRMGGLEALPLLRAVADTEVIVVSSIAQLGTEERRRCLALGAAAIIAKPSGAVSHDLAERRQRDLKAAIGLALTHRARLNTSGGDATPDMPVPDEAAPIQDTTEVEAEIVEMDVT